MKKSKRIKFRENMISYGPKILSSSLLSKVIKSVIRGLQKNAWTGPEGCRRLRLPDFKTVSA
jgi:hypothetical protein